MTTNYDQIADIYKETKQSPLRAHVDEFTFFTVLGDVHKKSVLDLACGYGHYSRLIKQRGATRVIGVDISESLIRQARNMEKKDPLNIEYRVKDVTNLGHVGNFDIVTAVYLFPYASTQQILSAMCKTIFNNLKPDGRLLAATLNPNVTDADLPVYAQYGVKLTTARGLQDGTRVTVSLEIADGDSVELSGYYWGRTSYEVALKRAGFKKITWHPMQVSQVGLHEFGEDYWRPYLAKPVDIVLECYK